MSEYKNFILLSNSLFPVSGYKRTEFGGTNNECKFIIGEFNILKEAIDKLNEYERSDIIKREELKIYDTQLKSYINHCE